MEQHTAHSRREETIRMIGQGLAKSDKLTLKHCYAKRDKDLRQEWERRNSQIRREKKRAMGKINDSEWH